VPDRGIAQDSKDVIRASVVDERDQNSEARTSATLVAHTAIKAGREREIEEGIN
jgi:hypothetical protein